MQTNLKKAKSIDKMKKKTFCIRSALSPLPLSSLVSFVHTQLHTKPSQTDRGDHLWGRGSRERALKRK